MARARIAILACLLALAPSALAAYGDLDGTDPSGDVLTSLVVAPTTGACDAPATDVLGYHLRVAGGDLVASMDLRDADAPMTCDDTVVGPHNGGSWSFHLRPADESPNATNNVSYVDIAVRPTSATHAITCTAVYTPAGHNSTCWRGVPLSSLFAGDTWSLSVPLVGTVRQNDTFVPYDLRGNDYVVHVSSAISYGTTSVPVGNSRDFVDSAPYAL
ncbi:MAG TPA: hypothetical protein VNX21_00335 [Candidatus Thermoplasmatota archaeon]|nr:hypothetical protein [Candidatus Thermoplasmatota archaeon]